MDDLKVAAVCMHAEPGEIQKNLDQIRAFVLEASANETDIICFPELSATGYVLKNPGDVYRQCAQENTRNQLILMAREAGLVLIAGFIEMSDHDKPYISQIITGPDGLIGIYRKTHLSSTEKDFYETGDEIKVFSHENTTFGVQLCYEAHFPEISTSMALMGADVLFIPHASPRGDPGEKFKSWLRHLTARAFDNGLFVVVCNQVGKTEKAFSFPGVAVILGPDGRVLATYAGDNQKILYAELKAESLNNVRQNRMKYFLPHRRPELYEKIISSNKLPSCFRNG